MHTHWKAIAPPESRTELELELQACKLLGETLDNKAIYLYKSAPDQAHSSLLREVGRLREEAFRLVGEGTGFERDVDAYDLYYMHIILWDRLDREIVGAYRLCRTNLFFEGDSRRIYTSSLFQYQSPAEDILRKGLELGRSFVQEKYWGSRSLDYLWSGIAAFLREHPEYRYLLGAVSISNDLSAHAKELLVGYYQRYYGTSDQKVLCKQPYELSEKALAHIEELFRGLDSRQAFVVLKKQLRYLGYVVPVLYKQYTELTEEGGSQFLGFNIDPDFNDCIDGLVVVDIHKITPLKRKRYGLDRMNQA